MIKQRKDRSGEDCYYYIKMDDAREFMHNLAGFGHHQVLIFGDYMKQIKKIAKVMGFKVLEG